jgi:hypothetical protein
MHVTPLASKLHNTQSGQYFGSTTAGKLAVKTGCHTSKLLHFVMVMMGVDAVRAAALY